MNTPDADTEAAPFRATFVEAARRASPPLQTADAATVLAAFTGAASVSRTAAVWWGDTAADAAFVEWCRRDPAVAWAGLRWLRQRMDCAGVVSSAPDGGDIGAILTVAPAWETLRVSCPRPPVALWRFVAVGDAAFPLATYGVDGCAGDAFVLARIRQSRSLRLPSPLQAGCARHEILQLRRAIRAWQAGRPSGPARWHVQVADPATLAWVADLGRTPTLTRSRSDVHTGLTASAALDLDGDLLHIRALLRAPWDIHAGPRAAHDAWCTRAAGDRVESGAVRETFVPGEDAEPAPDIRWSAPSGRAWQASRGCAHRRACWHTNITESALVLGCPDCANPRVALCWRDDLPDGHPLRLRPGSDAQITLAAMRDALGMIGPLAPHGTPWTNAMLRPSAWRDPDERPPSVAGGPPEVVLGVRRRTPRRARGSCPVMEDPGPARGMR